jgi:periplasmic divalent cation tolerance protein
MEQLVERRLFAPPRLSSLERVLELGIGLGRGRVFVDLWDAEKLAACVQISPVASCYVWKGELCEETEFLMQMKHRREDYPALADLVRRLHSYETPEILRIDAAEADAAYSAWLFETTRRA